MKPKWYYVREVSCAWWCIRDGSCDYCHYVKGNYNEIVGYVHRLNVQDIKRSFYFGLIDSLDILEALDAGKLSNSYKLEETTKMDEGVTLQNLLDEAVCIAKEYNTKLKEFEQKLSTEHGITVESNDDFMEQYCMMMTQEESPDLTLLNLPPQRKFYKVLPTSERSGFRQYYIYGTKESVHQHIKHNNLKFRACNIGSADCELEHVNNKQELDDLRSGKIFSICVD